MLVLNLPFKTLMFLTLMRPTLVSFLVVWLKLVKDFLKVRCRLALLTILISCLIWLDLVASLPLIKENCIHQTLNSKASTRFHSGGLQQSWTLILNTFLFGGIILIANILKRAFSSQLASNLRNRRLVL